MKIEIRPANTSTELEALVALDVRIFSSDSFDDPDMWKDFEVFWIVLDGEIIGSTAFGLNLEFSISEEEEIPSPGCVYLATTGILPGNQKRGIGGRVKEWQINWARSHGFTRISTHCRESNIGSLHLNRRFGFEVIGRLANYYEDPDEATIVMELKL